MDYSKRPWWRFLKTLDLGLMGAILLGSLAISSRSFALPSLAYLLVIRIKVVNLFLLIGYLALCSSILSLSGFYRSHRLSTFQQRLHEVLLASTLMTLALLILRWPFRLDFASNTFLIVYWGLSFVVLGATRETAQRLLHAVRSRGRNLRNVVIVAAGDDLNALAAYVAADPGLGYRVAGTVDAKEIDEDERYASVG
jgi:FlaA1/EpsC-like NDP-sugar epimerase